MIDVTVILIPGLVFIIGLIFGSFFNVMICRLPVNRSIVWPGSHCPDCESPLKIWHNIPLFSYLFLRGRCAFCKEKISIQYPAVEILTGVLTVFLWFALGKDILTEDRWWLRLYGLAQTGSLLILIPVTLIDLRHYIIPDSITLGGLIAGLSLSFIPGGTTPLQALLGAAAGGGTLLSVGFLGELVFKKKEAMGGGDIKLMACIGAFWGWKTVLLGIVFASFLGALAGIILIAFGTLRKDHQIPFGPFLAAGSWVAVLYGDSLLTAYIRFIDLTVLL